MAFPVTPIVAALVGSGVLLVAAILGAVSCTDGEGPIVAVIVIGEFGLGTAFVAVILAGLGRCRDSAPFVVLAGAGIGASFGFAAIFLEFIMCRPGVFAAFFSAIVQWAPVLMLSSSYALVVLALAVVPALVWLRWKEKDEPAPMEEPKVLWIKMREEVMIPPPHTP